MLSLLLFAALLGQAQPQDPPQSAYQNWTIGLHGAGVEQPAADIQVGTPTFTNDGRVLGANTTIKTTAQPQVFYAYSGRSLCESSSASAAEPADAGFGWRVEMTSAPGRFSIAVLPFVGDKVVAPDVRRLNRLRVQASVGVTVRWRRMWNRGQKVPQTADQTVDLTLKPGDHVMLDFMTAGANPSAGCNAVGMALEIGVAPAKSTEILQSEMWLVHKLPNGTEQTERQAVRASVYGSVEYHFDAIKVATPGSDTSFSLGGRVSPYYADDGSVHAKLEIARVVDPAGSAGGQAGSTYDLVAKPDDVVSFNLPAGSALAGHQFSLRVKLSLLQR